MQSCITMLTATMHAPFLSTLCIPLAYMTACLTNVTGVKAIKYGNYHYFCCSGQRSVKANAIFGKFLLVSLQETPFAEGNPALVIVQIHSLYRHSTVYIPQVLQMLSDRELEFYG